MSVRLFGPNLSGAVNLYHSGLRYLLGLPQVSLRSLSVSLRSLLALCPYLVSQTEPKILRLVDVNHHIFIHSSFSIFCVLSRGLEKCTMLTLPE